MSSNQKVSGSIPWIPQLHVEVLLSKILNPRIAPNEQAGALHSSLCHQYECVCEWVNVTSVVKRFPCSVDTVHCVL